MGPKTVNSSDRRETLFEAGYLFTTLSASEFEFVPQLSLAAQGWWTLKRVTAWVVKDWKTTVSSPNIGDWEWRGQIPNGTMD